MTEFVPVQVLMPDDLFKPREARLSRNPTERDQIPLTGAGGRVPAAGVIVGDPPPAVLTIHGAALDLSIQASSDGLPIAGLCAQEHHDTDGVAPYIILAKSGGTAAAPTVVAAGEVLGIISACGFDGTDYEEAASINFLVSGTPGDNDLGGKIVLSVAPDGGFLAVAAVTIDQDKSVTLAGALTVTGTITPAATQTMPASFTEVVTAASLTDGLAAIGTTTLAGTIPAGARYIGTMITPTAGFIGDVSAVATLGDGVDADRYNTGTPSIFAAAANGIETGAPSGTLQHVAAIHPVLTVTSAADITPVIAGGGSLIVKCMWWPAVQRMGGIGDFYEGIAKAAADVGSTLVDQTGVYGINRTGRTVQRGFQKAPTFRPLRAPQLKIDAAAADAAAAHQKDLLAVAFGLNDTKLTGQQGLGSVPKSLLTPKTTLGGY